MNSFHHQVFHLNHHICLQLQQDKEIKKNFYFFGGREGEANERRTLSSDKYQKPSLCWKQKYDPIEKLLLVGHK
jgi:hypothetical protein